jgi:hypothetical protein
LGLGPWENFGIGAWNFLGAAEKFWGIIFWKKFSSGRAFWAGIFCERMVAVGRSEMKKIKS